MAMNHSFGDHVLMYEEWRPTSTSSAWDIAQGILCLVTGLFGFIGNCFAFGYFHGKRDLASQLYKHICCMDIMICLGQIPVIQALLSGRNPGMFNNKMFCDIWNFLFDTIFRFYPMAVLLLSASRTVAIVLPFYRIKKWQVITLLYVCLLYSGLRQGGLLLAGFLSVYGADTATCYPIPGDDLTDSQNFIVQMDYFLLSTDVTLPGILIFISFVISTIKLLSKSKVSSAQARHCRAAITITIFTGVFLLCFLPFCAMFTLLAISTVIYKDEVHNYKPFSNSFINWYAWTLSGFFMNTLNASLVVVVYLTRMNNFRSWLTHLMWRRTAIAPSSASEIRFTSAAT